MRAHSLIAFAAAAMAAPAPLGNDRPWHHGHHTPGATWPTLPHHTPGAHTWPAPPHHTPRPGGGDGGFPHHPFPHGHPGNQERGIVKTFTNAQGTVTISWEAPTGWPTPTTFASIHPGGPLGSVPTPIPGGPLLNHPKPPHGSHHYGGQPFPTPGPGFRPHRGEPGPGRT